MVYFSQFHVQFASHVIYQQLLIYLRARSDSDFFEMVQTGSGSGNGSIQSGIIFTAHVLIRVFGFKVTRKY